MSEPKKNFWEYSKWRYRDGINANMPGGFFNDLDPNISFKRELPVHRRCAELCLQGFTNNEIARTVGRTKAHVSQVLRQPHIRLYMQEAVKRTVDQEMQEFLEGELMANMQTLKELRDDVTAKPLERIAAIKELNERKLGKASQPIRLDKPVSEMSSEELAAQAAEVIRSLGNTDSADANSKAA